MTTKQKRSPGRTSRREASALPDVEAWFAAQPAARNGGRVCWICSRPEVAEWVAKIAALNETSAKRVSWPQAHKVLVERMGYPYAPTTLMTHVREHGTRARS